MKTLWVEMRGKDTADFLHRQMTADIYALKKQGEGALTFWLNPMGRIELACAVWKQEAGYALQCPLVGGLPSREEVLAFLDRWHFGEDISFKESFRYDRAVSGRPLEGEPALSEGGFLWPSGQGFGATHFEVGEGLELYPEPFDGIRRFGMEIQIGRNPLDLGLGDFIPQQKGCYPGQEVIERIRSKGQAAARCVLIHKPQHAPIAPGESLDEDKGVVTSVYPEHAVLLVRRLSVVESLTYRGEGCRLAKDPW